MSQTEIKRYSVYINTIIFIFGAIIYYLGGSNIMGTILIAVVAINVLSMLLLNQKLNRFFFAVYLINAIVALIVSYDYYFNGKSKFTHIVWLAIAVTYFVVALFFLRKSKKSKSK
ncbi:MAG: hypothetical protein JXA03_04300 [Bacteroidales bacterium]|nr:hypothetical protein [Bacteroidales bacterium]